MNENKYLFEVEELLNDLLCAGKEELDEVEMLCGCTGVSCQSNWLSIGK